MIVLNFFKYSNFKVDSEAIEGAVSYQTAVLSYCEGFLLIGLICLCILPVAFLAKIKKGEVIDLGASH